MRPDCFADEVAIDFPSTGCLVDRAREAFFAGTAPDRPEILTTDMHLSSEEAYYGAVLPLDVPLRLTCPVCGGRGETWAEPCVACSGTGDYLARCTVRISVPPRVADGTLFRFRVRSEHGSPQRVEVRIAIRPLRV
jgi:DnaJ-class molecular chaperone